MSENNNDWFEDRLLLVVAAGLVLGFILLLPSLLEAVR